MSQNSDRVAQLVSVDAEDAARTRIVRTLAESRALLTGHFALPRGRHSMTALRFRSVGRNPAFMSAVVETIVARAPAELTHELKGAKILTPESSGLFLGRALAEHYRTMQAIAHTDLRRLPTRKLLVGSIRPNDRIVLVNDIAGTGTSLDALRQLVAERGGLAVGVALFAVARGTGVAEYCRKWQLPWYRVATARWETYAPESCPGCKSGEPLTPVTAEFI